MAKPNRARGSEKSLQPELTPNELSGLREVIASDQKKGAHLEIGTAAGGTLRELLLCYENPRPRFVVVDPFTYFPNQIDIVKRNLKSAGLDGEAVELRKSFSWPALKKAIKNNELYDFMFIDGHHGAGYVIQDLRWTRLLQVDGIVCLHDYANPKFPGVTWAVNRFMRANPNYSRVSQSDSLLILRKTSHGKAEISWIDLINGQIANKWFKLLASLNKRFGLDKPPHH